MNGIFTNEQLAAMKDEFNTLLRSTGRPGIENLIAWLEQKTDFYMAPASQGYHGCFPGGLLSHSLNVYHAAVKLKEAFAAVALPERKINEISTESVIISTLLHDLCKVNIYKEDIKFFKDDNNQWHKYLTYNIDDPVPLGHATKSMYYIMNFIRLSISESCAILWHMQSVNAFMTNPSNTYDYKPLLQADEQYPLTLIVAQADMVATFMMEQIVDQKTVNQIS